MKNKIDDLGNEIIGQEEALAHLRGLQHIYRWFLDEFFLNKE